MAPPVCISFPQDGASLKIEGAAEFTQNLFTGSNTQYTIWLRGDNLEGKNFELGLDTDCTGATAYHVRMREHS